MSSAAEILLESVFSPAMMKGETESKFVTDLQIGDVLIRRDQQGRIRVRGTIKKIIRQHDSGCTMYVTGGWHIESDKPVFNGCYFRGGIVEVQR